MTSKLRVKGADTIEETRTIASSVVGMDYNDAIDLVAARGRILRLTKLDGKPRIITRDFRLDRINVEVIGGKIVSVDIG